MSLEDLKKMAVVGLDGKEFYEATYKGQLYVMDIVNNEMAIYSSEPINRHSVHSGNWYYLDVKIEELDSVIEHKMYVTYKGNEYEVISASTHLKSFLIQGREDHVDEDLALGFDREMYKNMSFDKRIAYEEAESIRIESRDVYLELLEKYGGR